MEHKTENNTQENARFLLTEAGEQALSLNAAAVFYREAIGNQDEQIQALKSELEEARRENSRPTLEAVR